MRSEVALITNYTGCYGEFGKIHIKLNIHQRSQNERISTYTYVDDVATLLARNCG